VLCLPLAVVWRETERYSGGGGDQGITEVIITITITITINITIIVTITIIITITITITILTT
jgi:hypothetical protein